MRMYCIKSSSVAILTTHWRSAKDVARRMTKVSSFFLVPSDAIGQFTLSIVALTKYNTLDLFWFTYVCMPVARVYLALHITYFRCTVTGVSWHRICNLTYNDSINIICICIITYCILFIRLHTCVHQAGAQSIPRSAKMWTRKCQPQVAVHLGHAQHCSDVIYVPLWPITKNPLVWMVASSCKIVLRMCM